MLAVHNPLGPVSTAACLHLNLSCSNFGVPVQLEWEAACCHVGTRDWAWSSTGISRRRSRANGMLQPGTCSALSSSKSSWIGPLGARAKHWATGGSSRETGFGPPALAVPGTSRASAR
jgi:hypothetical protein